MIIPITKMICVPNVVCVTEIISISEIVRIPEIVSVPKIVRVPEVGSGISLVPHASDGWISVILESCEPIRLVDICSRIWTRTGKRWPMLVNRRLTKPGRPVRTHSQ
jgi:hypothetical protein